MYYSRLKFLLFYITPTKLFKTHALKSVMEKAEFPIILCLILTIFLSFTKYIKTKYKFSKVYGKLKRTKKKLNLACNHLNISLLVNR